ncbi:hypothetical protein CEXT_368211 [Caerostris extrusa]|uniref:Uncharacterized protein n=1 Tax=Caerostris extrusa TaxID=172846 RepID=A0AAV4VZG2_CAEEX|nr:hypothetical protein CEXT_368211 [Caerostris extrusa]
MCKDVTSIWSKYTVHNRSHEIPLTYDCCKGSSACVKLLLKMDADVQISKNGRTPLHEINALGIILHTPLHDACYAEVLIAQIAFKNGC